MPCLPSRTRSDADFLHGVGPVGALRRPPIEVGGRRLQVQRACRVVGLSRAPSCGPRPSMAVRDAAEIDTLTTLVAERRRWSF